MLSRKKTLLLTLLVAALLSSCAGEAGLSPTPAPTAQEDYNASQGYDDPAIYHDEVRDDNVTTAGETWLDPDGTYSDYEDVALYLHTYGELPDKFITKAEARELGWEGGSVERYAPGMCIGGDTFGNYEGILPRGNYHECDVGTLGENSRGAERIVWDDAGNIYYTSDHYGSFELLYQAP